MSEQVPTERPRSANSPPTPSAIIVMGVSGAGKSTIGQLLAARIGAEFVDGDDLHPQANRDKMAAGIALTDADRWPWLDLVGAVIGRALAVDHRIVVACSALRVVYRERILESLSENSDRPNSRTDSKACGAEVLFVHLVGSREALLARLRGRRNHYMPPSLLDSQLATLEPLGAGENGAEVSIDLEPERIVDAILQLHPICGLNFSS